MIARGEIWWADLRDPVGSAPGYRRPVVIVQSDIFNRSRIATVTVVSLTSSIRFVDSPGNVLIPATASGLPRDAVVNVSQISTIDRDELAECVCKLAPALMRQVDDGLRFALDF